MKIDSIRYRAFATNSSSVHTPIIVTNKTPEDFLIEHCEFHWEAFIASSEEARRKYIGTALSQQIPLKDFELRKAIVQQWAGATIEEGGIDHQSLPLIPCRYGTKTPHREYFNQLLKWFIQKGLVIVGGNDNDNDSNDTFDTISRIEKECNGKVIKFPYPKDDSHHGQIVCRFDPKGFYTIFDRKYGTKIRMSFDSAVNMQKSMYPELVDLKITGKCDKGCAYCYQASTPGGDHALWPDIRVIIDALVKMEVFEIAIGGGEPTLHPNFLDILKYAGERGITPSFSTRNLSWINKESVEVFKQYCGAFAYSIDSASDIEALEKVYEEFDVGGSYSKNSVTLQFVLRPTVSQQDLDAIFKRNVNHHFPLTILGFKPIGRALGVGKARCDIDWARILDVYGISIDTAAAKLYEEEILKCGAADWSLKIIEGTHSMYIDVVKKKMGPSSYCCENQFTYYEGILNGRSFETEEMRFDNFISEVFAGYSS